MKHIFLDFETFYSKTFSLKKLSNREYVFSPEFKVHGCGVAIDKGEPQWFKGAQLETVLRAVVPGNAVICHHAPFDVSITEWIYGLRPSLICDTLSLSRAIIGERIKSHSLDSVAKLLLGRDKGHYLSSTMGYRDLSAEQEKLLANYCAYDPNSDLRLCRDIFYALIPYMPRQELPIMDMVTRMYTEPKLYLDLELLIEYHSEVVARKLRALDEAGIADPKEVRSNPQFAEALKRLGVEPPLKKSPTVKNEDGTPALSYAFAKTDEALQLLADHEDERVQALVAARLENKSTLAETRAVKFITAARYGEYPVNYAFSGAQTTHRLSGQGGDNPQNLPRAGKLRKALMAPPGHVLIKGDMSQVELRATLALAVEFFRMHGFDPAKTEEHKALVMLAEGGDLYSDFGTELYGRTITREDEEDRHVAKECVLGSGYQMGPTKLVTYLQGKGITVTREFADRAIGAYRQRFKGVQGVWNYLQIAFKRKLTEPDREIVLFEQPHITLTQEPLFKDTAVKIPPTGLYVKYPGLRTRQKTETEMGGLCYDRAKDGTVGLFGGKILQNMIECLTRNITLHRTYEMNKVYPAVISTHDEAVLIAPEDEREHAKAYVKDTMEKPVPWWPGLLLNAEVRTGVNYGECK